MLRSDSRGATREGEHTLATRIDRAEYEEPFERGWDWFLRFHRATVMDVKDRSVLDVRDDLSMDSLGLSPPSVSPVSVPIGPVHGDFQPKNIFVDGGSITSITDWEYGARRTVQLVDAAQYLLRFASVLFGDMKVGYDKTFREQSESSAFVSSQIRRYCAEMAVTPEHLKLYLPYPYIRFLRIHERLGSFSLFTDARYMVEIVEYIWRNSING